MAVSMEGHEFVSLTSTENGSLIHKTHNGSFRPDLLACRNRLELYCTVSSEDTVCLNVNGKGLCLVAVCDGKARSVPLYLLNFRNRLDASLKLNFTNQGNQVISIFNGEMLTTEIEQEKNIQAKLTILKGQFDSTFSMNDELLLQQTCDLATDGNRPKVSGKNQADIFPCLNDTENNNDFLIYDPDYLDNGDDVNKYRKSDDKIRHDGNEYRKSDDKIRHDGNEYRKSDGKIRHDGNEYRKSDDKIRHDGNEYRKSDGKIRHDGNEYRKSDCKIRHDDNKYSQICDFKMNILENDVNKNRGFKNEDDEFDVCEDEKKDKDENDCDDQELYVSGSTGNEFNSLDDKVPTYNVDDEKLHNYTITQCPRPFISSGPDTFGDRLEETEREESAEVDIRTHRTELLQNMRADFLSDFFFEAKLISEKNMEDVNEAWYKQDKRAANRLLLKILRNRKIPKRKIEPVLMKAEEQYLLTLMFPQ